MKHHQIGHYCIMFIFDFKYILIILYGLRGPMSSNHGNILNELVILVRGSYGVLHVIINSTGVGVGDRDGTTSGERRCGCDETAEAGVGRGRQCMLEGSGREGWGKGHS